MRKLKTWEMVAVAAVGVLLFPEVLPFLLAKKGGDANGQGQGGNVAGGGYKPAPAQPGLIDTYGPKLVDLAGAAFKAWNKDSGKDYGDQGISGTGYDGASGGDAGWSGGDDYEDYA